MARAGQLTWSRDEAFIYTQLGVRSRHDTPLSWQKTLLRIRAKLADLHSTETEPNPPYHKEDRCG
eukprot:2866610-Pleurochrysis_carterae.AAC.1